MSNRSKRAAIAQETINILDNGYYQNNLGEIVSIKESLHNAITNSALYPPESFRNVFAKRDNKLQSNNRFETVFEVESETTLHAVKRLLDEGLNDVLCLNFASAKNPGGGFLGGSQAQEESLARASGLYPCISQMQAMYQTNRNFHSCLYTDYMIYSPLVPVFRDDDDALLQIPYHVSVITAPAVNVGALKQQKSKDIGRTQSVMLARTEKVLSLAVIQDHENLVLGAWGCGVFKNDPSDVANYFHHHLTENPMFKGAFKKIVFAVFGKEKDESNIKPFREAFLNA